MIPTLSWACHFYFLLIGRCSGSGLVIKKLLVWTLQQVIHELSPLCLLAGHLGSSKGTVAVMSVLQALFSYCGSTMVLWWYPFSRHFYPKEENLIQGQIIITGLAQGYTDELMAHSLRSLNLQMCTFCRGMILEWGGMLKINELGCHYGKGRYYEY